MLDRDGELSMKRDLPKISQDIIKRIGDLFQETTKYHRDRLPRGSLDWAAKPETYKTYPESKKVSLPAPETTGAAGLWGMIKERRSFRDFSARPLSLSELSQLLWAIQGITGKISGYELRAAPSAGALYPVETYIVANEVESLEQGVYHYNIREHALEQLLKGDCRIDIANACFGQRLMATASVDFIWTAILPRAKWKYMQRAYRYVFLDAGHIGQNLSLAAEALGLGCCCIGAFFDEEINTLIGVDGKEETVIYLSAVGKK